MAGPSSSEILICIIARRGRDWAGFCAHVGVILGSGLGCLGDAWGMLGGGLGDAWGMLGPWVGLIE